MLLTAAQAADYLDVSLDWIYKLLRAGKGKRQEVERGLAGRDRKPPRICG